MIGEIQRPNPLAGLRKADEDLRATIVTCMIGICCDQLGDALATLAKAAQEHTPRASAKTATTPARQTGKQLCILGMPMIAVLILRHFGILPGGVFLDGILLLAVVLVVFGPFVVVFPGRHDFLSGLKDLITLKPTEPPKSTEAPAEQRTSAPEQRTPSETTDPADTA